jgi:hypothetical protein
MATVAYIFGISGDWFYWSLAIAGTSLFVLKVVISLIAGAIGGDMDFDTDAADAADAADAGDALDGVDIEHGSGAAFTVVSLQSVLAFFGATGWAGLAALKEWDLSTGWAMVVAFSFGGFAMLLNAGLMYMARRLNAAGRVDLQTAVGRLGRVYMRIPPAGEGLGQVQVTASGGRRICPAASNGPAIESFTTVKILEVRDKQLLLVGPVDPPASAS